MSKTLLAVLTHPEAAPILEMNWRWLIRSGCEMAVVHHEGELYRKRLDANYNLTIGTDPCAMPHRWVSRFVDVLRWFNENTIGYEAICVVESDVIFVRALPEFPDNADVVATLAGGNSDGFVGSKFWHCPWWISKSGVRNILRAADRMMRVGLDERGFIDRFLGLVADLYPLEFGLSGNYSRNTIEGLDEIAEARAAIKTGAWALHGVKSPEVLFRLTEGL